MTDWNSASDAMADAVFPIDGKSLPRDHAQALQQALCAQLPWLETDALAGIHPIKLVPGSDELALLSGRACLLLRVGARRVGELIALPDLDLSVAGHPLHLGVPHRRELQPHATLYAYQVAAESADEMTFMTAMDHALAELAIGGERVCGKHQRMRVSGRVLDTFSLMLHALPADQSLRLQQCGLGPYRLLGCGLFVPHKSAAAV